MYITKLYDSVCSVLFFGCQIQIQNSYYLLNLKVDPQLLKLLWTLKDCEISLQTGHHSCDNKPLIRSHDKL